MKHTSFFIRLILTLFAASTLSLFAANEIKRESDSATFSTLQAAIDDGSTADGETLLITADFADTSADASKEVTIAADPAVYTTGTNTRPTVTLSGNFVITAENVKISNVNIDNSGGGSPAVSIRASGFMFIHNELSMVNQGLKFETGTDIIDTMFIENIINGSTAQAGVVNTSGCSNIQYINNVFQNAPSCAIQINQLIRNFVFVGNLVNDTGAETIRFNGSLPGCENFYFSNNTIKSAGSTQVSAVTVFSGTNFVFVGNTFVDNNFGAIELQGASNVIIENNTISNSQRAITLKTNDSATITIRSNVLYGNWKPVTFLNGCDGFSFVSNYWRPLKTSF